MFLLVGCQVRYRCCRLDSDHPGCATRFKCCLASAGSAGCLRKYSCCGQGESFAGCRDRVGQVCSLRSSDLQIFDLFTQRKRIRGICQNLGVSLLNSVHTERSARNAARIGVPRLAPASSRTTIWSTSKGTPRRKADESQSIDRK